MASGIGGETLSVLIEPCGIETKYDGGIYEGGLEVLIEPCGIETDKLLLHSILLYVWF